MSAFDICAYAKSLKKSGISKDSRSPKLSNARNRNVPASAIAHLLFSMLTREQVPPHYATPGVSQAFPVSRKFMCTIRFFVHDSLCGEQIYRTARRASAQIPQDSTVLGRLVLGRLGRLRRGDSENRQAPCSSLQTPSGSHKPRWFSHGLAGSHRLTARIPRLPTATACPAAGSQPHRRGRWSTAQCAKHPPCRRAPQRPARAHAPNGSCS